jgi:hypothetical protein
MKYQSLFILFVAVVVTVSGCGGKAYAATSPTATDAAQAIEDQASFIAAVQAAGASVEVGDPITQAFFTPEGKTLKVNGADVCTSFDVPDSIFILKCILGIVYCFMPTMNHEGHV